MAARQHLVHDAVAAAGTVVGLVLQFFLALVSLVEDLCLGMYDFVIGFQIRHEPSAPFPRKPAHEPEQI